MKPIIEKTAFGSITIDGRTYDHDVIIRLDNGVKKRKKKLSKAVYGTSHLVAKEEIRNIFEKGAKLLVIGSGQYGRLALSDEARKFLQKKKCAVVIKATPEALKAWNNSDVKQIGLFHITC